jgi:hypothetical protein
MAGPQIITVPLGSGMVGIKCIAGPEGVPGVLMRALKVAAEIGGPVGEAEDFGVFVRCPKLSSAKVLQKAVNELVDMLEKEGDFGAA